MLNDGIGNLSYIYSIVIHYNLKLPFQMAMDMNGIMDYVKQKNDYNRIKYDHIPG